MDDGRGRWGRRRLLRAASTLTLGLVAALGAVPGAAAPEPTALESSQGEPTSEDLYGRALSRFRERTGEALLESYLLFEKAAERGADDARAHAGLASSGCLLALYSLARPDEVLPRAEAAAEQAVRLDPGLAEAWAALGLVDYLYHWDWTRSEKRFLEALERDPEYATARHWYGMSLMARSRFPEAVAQLDAAVRLAPDSRIIEVKRGTVLTAAGRFEAAQEQLLGAIRSFPSFALAHRELGFLYLQTGRVEAAVKAFERAAEIGGEASKSAAGLAIAYAASGREGRAREILDRFLERSRHELVSPMVVALMHAALGNAEAAFLWLENAYELHDPGLVYLDVKFGFEALRSDPRFEALIERIGLRGTAAASASGR